MCAMGPPGGGRNHITPRYSRHFNALSFTELEDSSKQRSEFNVVEYALYCRAHCCVIHVFQMHLKYLTDYFIS